SQTRSFCFVDDLVEGFIGLMAKEKGFTRPVNLGNPGEFTMLELTEMIIKLTNSKSNLSFQDLLQDDPKQRKPDIGLAKSELGWEPTINLEEVLEKTIHYFRSVVG
ncbi:SDR family NAD-dependent epimerase/dehydratase, partial [Gammaproteobacteria bacterium]|nr:SDR family NAD-dependent epimerase/dehydratase [Gammaproteobacteria bacterium]